MNTVLKNISWWLFAIMAILIGLYPLAYFYFDHSMGLLATKAADLLASHIWNVAFYGHVGFGGLALFIGWAQFHKGWRKRKLELHRLVGKIYVLAVLISGTCSLYIGYHATGGIISMTGFIGLGIFWLTSTSLAYRAALNKQFDAHEKWMIYSYAACFAAVTLRILLPILTIAMGDFIPAYRIIAWISWVPNLVVAYFIVNSRNQQIITA